jgi:hypothetical protein
MKDIFLISKRNIVSLIVAISITISFLTAVLTPPSSFNFIPYSIHESLNTSTSEKNFIVAFDYYFSIVVLIITYLLSRKFCETYRLLK